MISLVKNFAAHTFLNGNEQSIANLKASQFFFFCDEGNLIYMPGAHNHSLILQFLTFFKRFYLKNFNLLFLSFAISIFPKFHFCRFIFLELLIQLLDISISTIFIFFIVNFFKLSLN